MTRRTDMQYVINVTFDDGAHGAGSVTVDSHGCVYEFDVSTDFGPLVPGVQYCDTCTLSFGALEGNAIVLRRGNDSTPAFPFGQDYQELRLPLSGGGSEFYVDDGQTAILARGVVSGGIEAPTPVPVPVPWVGVVVLAMLLVLFAKREAQHG